MTEILSARGYARLLKDVGRLLDAGRAEAETKAGHVLAVTYWKVGTRIRREGLSERAGYGDGVVAQVADELGVSQSTLHRALRFATFYDAPPEPGLSWAHYQELLRVADAELRDGYAKLALAEGWSKRALRTAIAAKVLSPPSERGPVASKGIERPADASYLYGCEVAQVIDGDTLLVHVDLGFDVIRVQRLRLAWVDAPEAKTAAGKRAAQWVRERLATAVRVVVSTQKASDLHGRYVAHVFYTGDGSASAEQTFRRGQYLNAELLSQGLAERAV